MSDEPKQARERPGDGDGSTASAPPSLLDAPITSSLFEQFVESAAEGFVVVDDDGYVAYANTAMEEMLGYDPESIVGERLTALIPERYRKRYLDAFAEYLRTGERNVDAEYVEFPGLHRDGREVPLEITFREFSVDGTQYFVGSLRDVSRLVEQRERLEAETAFVESMLDALPDVVYAFDTSGQFVRWNERAREVTGYTDDEIASLDPLAFIPERDHQRVAESLDRVMGDGSVDTIESAIVTKDGTEIPYEFTGAPMYEDGEIIGETGVGRDITERKRRERMLERLDALNNVIRSVDTALIEATTRAEIETAVCDHLVSEGGYAGAVMGRFRNGSGEFSADASAGLASASEGGLLPETDLAPGRLAVDARSLEVETGLGTSAAEPAYRAVAAIPLVREERVFGVLGVYTDRTDAFGERERTILRELGEGIANAIQGALTHQLLYANTVTEIELRTTDRDLAFVDLSAVTDSRLELRRTFCYGNDVVFYVTVRDTDAETIRTEAREHPAFSTVEYLGTSDDEHRFEFVASDATLSATLTELGARTTAAEAERGVARLTVELPPDANVRELVAAIESAYGETEFVARREVNRSRQTPVEFRRRLAGDLTEKQRAALEAAYFSGYFEWPSRTNNAEDVADQLDIAPQTFHQHLRVAQEKLLTTLFEEERVGELG